MSDINDLSRPVTTDTEPNVLDTLKAHIIRAATWTGWSATANKVAGIMSATTAAVSGGRSLRLYRRNDANTTDEEIVSLPGISVGGSAGSAPASDVYSWAKQTTKPSYSWSEIGSKPTNVSAFTNDVGYLTSVSWGSVSGRPTNVSSFSNDSGYITGLSFNALSGKPTSLAGYGIPSSDVVLAMAGASAGGIGTYIFARISPTAAYDTNFNGLRAGSELIPTAAASIISGNATFGFASSGSLTGTWRCMGYGDYNVTDGALGYMTGSTLWLRIA